MKATRLLIPVFRSSASFIAAAAVIFLTFLGSAPAAVEIDVQQPMETSIPVGGSKDFGPADVDGVSLTFYIRNTGSTTLNLTGTPRVAVSGAHAADFVVTGQPAATVSGAPVTLTDSGFETPAQAPGGVVAAPAGSAWTFGSMTGLARNGVNASVPPMEGLQAAFIVDGAPGSVISRTINFPASGQYLISFIVARWYGQSGNDIDVSMDGTVVGSVLMTEGPEDARRIELLYDCPSAGNHVLAFNGKAPHAFYRTAVDDVQIAPAASFQVRFAPKGGGVRTAALSIASNDSNESPYDIAVSGTTVMHAEIAIEQVPGAPLATGTVAACGYNDSGQTNVPAGLYGVKSIAAGGYFATAVKADGTVASWGSIKQSQVPAGLSGVVKVAGGDMHALALKSDGTLAAWGSNLQGQTSIPAGLAGVKAIAASGLGSAAVRSDGSVVQWGSNAVPVPAGLVNVIDVARGSTHVVALKNDGTVVAWGENFSNEASVPAGLNGVVAIAASGYISLALKSDGTIVRWGRGIASPAASPGATAITASPVHVLALNPDGAVAGAGSDWHRQLSGMTPLQGVRMIAAGGANAMVPWNYSHSVAVMDSTVDFGSATAGVSSATRTFTIKSTGTDALKLTSAGISGRDASSFTLNTAGMLTTLSAFNGTTTFSVKFNPQTAGSKQARLRIVNNDRDEGDFYINLTGTAVVLSPLETWRQANFGTSTNAGDAADTFDFDKDGTSNLTEFAFGLNPKKADSALLPQAVFNGASYSYTFTQPAAVSGITYRGEWSSTLAADSWQPVPHMIAGGQHIFSVSTAGKPRVFMRIVTTAP